MGIPLLCAHCMDSYETTKCPNCGFAFCKSCKTIHQHIERGILTKIAHEHYHNKKNWIEATIIASQAIPSIEIHQALTRANHYTRLGKKCY